MASATRREDDGPDGIEFICAGDGTMTTRDLETELARGGDTRAEALAQLAEVLAVEAGDGEPTKDPTEFLYEVGVGPDGAEKSPPDSRGQENHRFTG